jgi:hypothetical protein
MPTVHETVYPHPRQSILKGKDIPIHGELFKLNDPVIDVARRIRRNDEIRLGDGHLVQGLDTIGNCVTVRRKEYAR